MAPPVPDPGMADAPLTPPRLWRLVRDPTPGRLGHALRMAAGCTTTVLVGEIWQVPDLAVPALVTLALWQKDRVTNAVAGVAVNLLIVILLVLIYGLIALTLDHPVALVLVITLLSFGFFFLGSASKLKPVAYMLGLIVVYGLVAIDQAPIGEIVTRALLYTDLFLAVPGAVMLVLGLLICPSPRRVLTDDIAARLRLSAALLRGTDAEARAHATGLLREGATGMTKALRMAGLERLWRPADLACLRQAADCAVAVLALADSEAAHQHDTRPQALPQALINTLEEMAAIFADGDYPTAIAAPTTPPDRPACAAMAALLAVFTTPDPTPGRQDAPAKKKGGFFAPDAFTNPVHVRFAVKGTAAVMTSYLLFRLIDWPGIHTCIITCFIVALPTMGEMIAKLTLRISGALIGGAIGIAAIIFVQPHLQDITGFLVLVFAVSLLAAWVKTGDERIAYAGLQIGLAFYLTDLKGYGPTSDMATARDRIVGIMLGNAITYAMFTSFWPTSAYDGIAQRLHAVAALLRRQRAATTRQEQAACVAALQSAVSQGERQVEYALAEPIHIRAEMDRITAFQTGFADAGRLGADMLDGTAVDPGARIAALEAPAS
ncbi:FUSC family protein [Gluconacetobacter tumulicola]|uniref:Fusaric acid resistance protein n=1 Tax=Gluconacetobacter tumulicola TaxID=1017177 RepID=A0A7W4P810_9PROT|nr:fusaric acid resistance protein [Gluconacetobacter tumulicola]